MVVRGCGKEMDGWRSVIEVQVDTTTTRTGSGVAKGGWVGEQVRERRVTGEIRVASRLITRPRRK